jgi:hypothetical protein
MCLHCLSIVTQITIMDKVELRSCCKTLWEVS